MCRAIIFDMDGTLLDTERFYKAAFIRAAARLDLKVSAELQEGIVGLASPDRAAMLRRAWGGDYPLDRFLALYREERRALLPFRVPLCAGALPALQEAARHGAALAVATSASRGTAMDHLRRAGLGGVFRHVVTRDDVTRGKPAPDVYLEAARRLSIAPDLCWAIEDSAPGVEAAQAAGMRCVRVASAWCGMADVTMRDLFALARWLRADNARPDYAQTTLARGAAL